MIYFILLAFAVGFLLNHVWSKAGLVKRYLNEYLIWFGLPLFTFVTLVVSKIELGLLFATSSILIIVFSLLVYFIVSLFRFKNSKKASLFLASTYGNSGYLGVPLSFMFFGAIGAAIAAIFAFVVSLVQFSLGVYLSNKYARQKASAIKNLLKFPLFWGILIAFTLSYFIHHVPDWLAVFSKTVTALDCKI